VGRCDDAPIARATGGRRSTGRSEMLRVRPRGAPRCDDRLREGLACLRFDDAERREKLLVVLEGRRCEPSGAGGASATSAACASGTRPSRPGARGTSFGWVSGGAQAGEPHSRSRPTKLSPRAPSVGALQMARIPQLARLRRKSDGRRIPAGDGSIGDSERNTISP
jgi:hypothetical protein